jgi:tetratricopeptide (TPR) repeat protein
LMLIARGQLDYMGGRFESAMDFAHEGLQISQASSIPFRIGMALGLLAEIALEMGDFELAQQRLDEELAYYSANGDRTRLAGLLREKGWISLRQKEYDTALRYGMQALEVAREHSNQLEETHIMDLLSSTALRMQKLEDAWQYTQQALVLARQRGDPESITYLLCQAGLIASAQGNPDQARKLYWESLTLSRTTGIRLTLAFVIFGMADLSFNEGNPMMAAELIGLCLRYQHPPWLLRSYANQLMERLLQAALPADALEAALERGRALDLDTVVAEFLDQD